jgi:hypothetical protein
MEPPSTYPLISRPQRYFADSKKAKLMRWHKERAHVENEVLRHPPDGKQWNVLDLAFSKFVNDARNLRLVI